MSRISRALTMKATATRVIVNGTASVRKARHCISIVLGSGKISYVRTIVHGMFHGRWYVSSVVTVAARTPAIATAPKEVMAFFDMMFP